MKQSRAMMPRQSLATIPLLALAPPIGVFTETEMMGRNEPRRPRSAEPMTILPWSPLRASQAVKGDGPLGGGGGEPSGGGGTGFEAMGHTLSSGSGGTLGESWKRDKTTLSLAGRQGAAVTFSDRSSTADSRQPEATFS